MIERRSMSQEEMDQCWKELAEKIEEEVLDKYRVEDRRGAYRGRGSSLEWWRVRKSRKYSIRKWVRRWLGKNLRFVQKIQPAASAKHA